MLHAFAVNFSVEGGGGGGRDLKRRETVDQGYVGYWGPMKIAYIGVVCTVEHLDIIKCSSNN